ncbi:Ca(2+)-dependent cysteine protease [Mortierella hygrophila]|uniref:Ca(2+)-dependent cysteine protease n=1 Tax=Mortierella hygrophila TaxID=979708 RepID=A0A9P6K8B2_9FUNG|nr:Ca(2+)-dependent cysteine protease [Mortierella hygrophila]
MSGYPGNYQPQPPYGAPPPAYPAYPPHGPPAGYPPQPGHYAPPAHAPGYPAAYPPPQHYPPPGAPAPYGAPPPGGAYPPPAASPYGAPPPAAHSPYGAPPAAHPPYGAPPIAHPPYGAPPVAYSSPYPQPAYRPPAATPPPITHIPQYMMTPANVAPPPQGWHMVQNTNIPAPTNFQLSNCTGRKRALLIGVNYFGQKAELRGCINDVRNIKAFIRRFGFREEDTVTLTDDQADPTRIPTKANILSGMQWLVRDARPNDSFFLHFSGHGGQTADLDGDEDDGYDNTIYPVDHTRAGVIVDDLMHDIMVKPLPAGCRLTAIMDCCHSGSALDLPFTYSTTGQLKDQNILQGVGSGIKGAGMSYLRGDLGGMMNSLGGIGKKIGRPNDRQRIIQTKSSPSDCVMFSGCKDNQTSADAKEAGFGMTGAMTFSFITALTANPRQSYLQLLNSIRDILRAKYEQKPQLSSSHPVDLNLIFTM